MKLAALRKPALRLIKDLSLKTGILRGRLFHKYPFMFMPHQLEFLMQSLRQTQDVPGACVEIGCAEGSTTIFLNKYLEHLGDERRYIALDTFSGFTKDHADYEINVLKKDEALADAFSVNRKEWVSTSLGLSDITNVELIEGDASKYDFSQIGGISFCLLDVDLYQPISVILPKVYPELSPGAILIVDDCRVHHMWGALPAYEEFIAEKSLTREITCDKLGIIRKSG